jgi:hypothetical protein
MLGLLDVAPHAEQDAEIGHGGGVAGVGRVPPPLLGLLDVAPLPEQEAGSNNYWTSLTTVPRPAATDATERRVAILVDRLFSGVGDGSESVAAVARSAGLGHETVRRLWRNPGGRRRSGPGFFVVAAVARARGVSLDWLASESLRDDSLVGSE